MLTTTTPPALADDHHSHPVSPQPTLGEYGVVAFYRDIATMLARTLRHPMPELTFRHNPYRPGVPQISHGEWDMRGHTVTVVVIHPPRYAEDTVYALLIDGQPVPIVTTGHQRSDAVLATAAYIALMDLPNHP